MLDFVFLTDRFYMDHAACPEIESKKDRPHAQVSIQVGSYLFCIPLRSHIMHEYAFWTDKENHCGLDFSKAVVITDPEKYIDRTRKPFLRQNEYEALKDVNPYVISRRLLFYIQQYKKAKAAPEKKRNALLVKYSTLQYFEEFLVF